MLPSPSGGIIGRLDISGVCLNAESIDRMGAWPLRWGFRQGCEGWRVQDSVSAHRPCCHHAGVLWRLRAAGAPVAMGARTLLVPGRCLSEPLSTDCVLACLSPLSALNALDACCKSQGSSLAMSHRAGIAPHPQSALSVCPGRLDRRGQSRAGVHAASCDAEQWCEGCVHDACICCRLH